MGDNIPDEILSEILSPALRVPDEMFSVMTSEKNSPFHSKSESSSAFLLVCKSWLRVATPLLYNVVVLRSKGQAQALAGVLTANPVLGKFIRKLRLEGGYAISMFKILQEAPNISDIFLTLNIKTPDNVCGLCRGLQLIQPIRIILFGTRDWYFNSSLLWFKLADELLGSSKLVQGLGRAPNLATLVVSNPPKFLLRHIREISNNHSLRRIRVTPFGSWAGNQRLYWDHVKQDKRIAALFDFPDEGSPPNNTPPPFIYPPRLAADPLQEDAIWSRVLYFLSRSAPLIGRRCEWKPAPMAPILVCKKFMRLGLPHFYTSPFLQGSALQSFADRMSQHPPLGRHVRQLTISHRGNSDLFKGIIASTTSLVELYGMPKSSPIDWESFSHLGECTGSTLSSFEDVPVLEAGPFKFASPAVFELFPQMRFFGWDSPISFKLQGEPIPPDTFNNLVRLTVDEFHSSFLEVLAQMELPALRAAAFSATAEGGGDFFQKHGEKLEDLTVSVLQMADSDLAILQNCPSITTIGISFDDETFVSKWWPLADSHACLERIVFQNRTPHRMKPAQRESFGRFLRSLDLASFPALRQVEHPNCSWPTTDREISRSQWVRWAEALLKQKIQLVDSTGAHWRPRLKYVPNLTRKR
ncbi:hypothetical protein DFH08DRAFT_834739 [Mycena albidolilacea]|uniref:Uncharacterized protein n=1 Tax=Mycena albidolilacea TaxID=1033008 RepID=A0AAD7ARB3_9AGAR|nr:hypothetical protein DFH08DRAFT_834739 [Mycena albidolilacea]